MKNEGFTLIEILVVVLIIGIGLGIVFMSMNSVYILNTTESAKDIVSELGKEKIAAMTRTGEVYLYVYKTTSGIYADEYENDTLKVSGIFLGKATVAVKYCTETNTAGTPLDSDGIVIAFNKYNGSFKTIGEAWALMNPASNPANGSEYYKKLIVSGGNITRTIVLWPQTGKFSYTG